MHPEQSDCRVVSNPTLGRLPAHSQPREGVASVFKWALAEELEGIEGNPAHEACALVGSTSVRVATLHAAKERAQQTDHIGAADLAAAAKDQRGYANRRHDIVTYASGRPFTGRVSATRWRLVYPNGLREAG